MASIHLFNIDKLKSDFQSILQKQNSNNQSNMILDEQINNLKETYNNMVKQNTKKIFLFCLDSFYFQYKTILLEMDNIKRYNAMLHNRMYGDYYKLYNIILTQTGDNHAIIKELTVDFKKYEPYRDLEPFHEYKPMTITGLHNDILRTINYLYVHFLSKEQNILHYSDNTSRGMSIGNFMQTLNYENVIFREQISLYVNYLAFFHSSHMEYLVKQETRIQKLLQEVEEDILNQKQEMMSVENQNNILGIRSQIEDSSAMRKSEIQTTIENVMKEIDDEDTSIEVEINDSQPIKLEILMPNKTKEIEEPITEKKEEPSTEKKEEPSTEKKEEPSTEKKEEPSTEKKEEPSTEKKEEPSIEKK